MLNLKVIEYRAKQIQSWQMLVVVGETKEQLSERTGKSISGLNEKFEYEFRTYPVVEINKEESEEIQNCDADQLKDIPMSEVEIEEVTLVEGCEDLELEIS